MTQPITLTRVLKAISESEIGWYEEHTGNGQVITYSFFTTMMLEKELINNDRKIREWWNHLHTTRYVTAINSKAARINAQKFAQKMKLEITIRRLPE
jgi:hypothetical protein